jgi:hypothetical protein
MGRGSMNWEIRLAARGVCGVPGTGVGVVVEVPVVVLVVELVVELVEVLVEVLVWVLVAVLVVVLVVVSVVLEQDDRTRLKIKARKKMEYSNFFTNGPPPIITNTYEDRVLPIEML